MIHLRALPGSPEAEPMARTIEAALQDARVLVEELALVQGLVKAGQQDLAIEAQLLAQRGSG